MRHAFIGLIGAAAVLGGYLLLGARSRVAVEKTQGHSAGGRSSAARSQRASVAARSYVLW